ncbi:MAG: hypothetical protein J1E40_03725 [Oscillospiraceae bacterium]|nr:hypothetical protein [Oscillospiraceae bacterium]
MKRVYYNLLLLLFLINLCGCSNNNNDISVHINEESITENTTVSTSSEPVFTGLNIQDTDTDFSPLVNKKSMNHQLFCYDDNGNIYFSDPMNNYSLYSYDGTKTKLLADVPAYCLNYYDGKIYFLSENKIINIEDRISPEGYPFECDIGSGEMSQIRERKITGMTVIDGEIYGINEENACYVYRYDRTSDTEEKLFNSFDIAKAGKYFLTFEPGADRIDFYLESKDDKILFINDDIPLNSCFCYGKFYYKSQSDYALKVIDLQSGERKSLDGSADYSFLNGDLYVLNNDHHLCRYDGNDFIIMEEMNQYEYIYSDNKNLFGIKKEYSLSARVMEYFFVKINGDFSIEILSGNEGDQCSEK